MSRDPSSRDYGRRVLLDHPNPATLGALHQHRQNGGEAYEELKRLIIFAGIFFLFMIIFVLLKFRVSLEDVFKWSPVVWLVGVIICGLAMNAFLQVRRIFRKRREKRLREQQNLLYSLNLPTSFPCLAPPPHDGQCCSLFCSRERDGRGLEWLESGSANLIRATPLPNYEQVMDGARTWLLSKAAFPSSLVMRPLPPTYSTVDVESQNPHPSSHPEPPPPPDGSSDRPPPLYEDGNGRLEL